MGSEGIVSFLERVRGPESTKNFYSLPYPKGTAVKGIIKDSPAHKGPFKGALDFLVDLGTPVLSPAAGVTTEVVDENDRSGPTEEFKESLNYITIRHSNGEFSQVAHLAQGSSRVKVGQTVTEGEILAATGQSGWMTRPHLHLLVFLNDPKSPGGFRGLKIRFKKS